MRRPAQGFVLMEAIVGLFLFGLTTTAVTAAINQAVVGTRAARDTLTALSIAQTELALATSFPLRPRDAQANEQQRFGVTLAVRLVPLDAVPKTEAIAAALALYDISVRVDWRAAGQRRELALATRRTGVLPDTNDRAAPARVAKRPAEVDEP